MDIIIMLSFKMHLFTVSKCYIIITFVCFITFEEDEMTSFVNLYS